jgi:tetratricopeptide (TPR) repeat protein
MSKSHFKRPRLSVAMIVRNEQDAIGLTLESIRQIADEIVIADTGSQDGTVAIARQWGAKVHHSAWADDFAAARNSCLKRVTGDWILWLDAGERLSPQSAKKVRDFVAGNPDPRNAYLMMVEAPPADAFSSPEQIAQIRLTPHLPNLIYEGRVRENLLRSLTAAGMEIETAPGRILRHPREHEPARKIARAKRNLALANLEKRENSHENIRLLLVEGDAFSALEMNDRAREAYSRAIEISDPGSTAMLEGFYGLMSCYNNNPQLHDCQLELGLKALETYPFDVQLLLAMGSYLQGRDRLDLASRSFDIAVKFGQVELTVWHMREIEEVATACLCMILQLQGQTEDACRELETAIARHPQSARLQRHGIELYIKTDRSQKAIELLAKQSPPGENLAALADAVRGACRAANTDWLPALALLQAAYFAGCRHPLCLRWMTVTLLANGQIEAARPVLEEWRQLEPNHPEMLAYLDALAQAGEPSESDISAETPARVPDGRQYRIDPAVTTTEITPLGLPLAQQFTSFDTMLPAENGQ